MNRLHLEKSPYLLQHQHNPVDWYPWGKEAFAKAQLENKPIFLSIGYSTCYWCHVMEKDSFEHQDLAQVLNQNFISIKVDREERPDVDRIYMDAVSAMTGHGGWPMSVFLTPDQKPFYGGTFFWKATFIKLLEKVTELWTNDRASLVESAAKLCQYLQDISQEELQKVTPNDDAFRRAFRIFERSFDPDWGGFGKAPKFPAAQSIRLLLRIYQRGNSRRSLEIAEKTLESMARGGIYDQLGGGFHRYAVDEKWQVPHFEKMLYDNALLARAYTEAYLLTNKNAYKQISRQTLHYVQTKMTSPKGGFYSAEDAGDVGLEGQTYLWKWHELEANLSAEELKLAVEVFGASCEGNFEHNQNILLLPQGVLWEKSFSPEVSQLKEKLLTLRNKREQPHLDDKILTSWNGLMINALAYAGRIFNQQDFIDSASAAAKFAAEHLITASGLKRRFREGQVDFSATIDDYVYLIYGLLELFLATNHWPWLEVAEKLYQLQDENLWDVKNGGYFYEEHSENLVIRSKEYHDGAQPSANQIAIENSYRLFQITGKLAYLKRAEELIESISGLMVASPQAGASSLIAFDFLQCGGFYIKAPQATSAEIIADLNKALGLSGVVFKTNEATADFELCAKDSCLYKGQEIKELKQLVSLRNQYQAELI
ncbi:thioredoxin domain-containing protein [bacterium]|nr:thioredoxin domain-containing protein [bacterium]